MDLGIPFLCNFWPLIPNPASVFVLHVRFSRKMTSKFGKFAFSTLLEALPCLYRGSQNFCKAWNTSPDIYSETFSIKNPPKNSFFVSFAINSAICRISIVTLLTNYNGNTTYQLSTSHGFPLPKEGHPTTCLRSSSLSLPCSCDEIK